MNAAHLCQVLSLAGHSVLSPLALRILMAVIILESRGLPPTWREVAKIALKGKSPLSVNAMQEPLNRLREAGLVTWEYGKLRTLRATCYLKLFPEATQEVSNG